MIQFVSGRAAGRPGPAAYPWRRRGAQIGGWLAACCGLLGAVPERVSGQADQDRDVTSLRSGFLEDQNPHTGSVDIETGRQLFLSTCAMCHGRDATGGRGPNLTQQRLRHGSTDKALFDNIQDGISGTGMVAFDFEERLLWQLVAFIQSKRQAAEPVTLGGDPVVGKQLFDKHQCGSCHWTGQAEGRRGPDLTKSSSTVDYVRQALVDANSDIDPRYRKAVILQTDGRVVQGLRLNENSYFIQVIDEHERLRTIAKADIEELRLPPESLMQSYHSELNSEDLNNLVAYLFALRGE